MTRYARPVNNIAVDVVDSPMAIDGYTFQLTDMFVPTLVAQFIPCPEEVQPGWTHDATANTWTAPPAPSVEPTGTEPASTSTT